MTLLGDEGDSQSWLGGVLGHAVVETLQYFRLRVRIRSRIEQARTLDALCHKEVSRVGFNAKNVHPREDRESETIQGTNERPVWNGENGQAKLPLRVLGIFASLVAVQLQHATDVRIHDGEKRGAHQVGSARSTLGVITAFRSAKGSFSSSSTSSSSSESLSAGALPCGDSWDCGLDMAEGLGGAAGRAGGGGGEAGVM